MHLPQHAMRLRIYFGEKRRNDGKPLYEAILKRARADGLAGATCSRAIAGYGANSRIKTAGILMLSEDLPLVIEIVETREKLDPFIAWLDGVLGEGLATLEPVEVLIYRHAGVSQRDDG